MRKATSDLIIKALNLDSNKKYTVNIEYMNDIKFYIDFPEDLLNDSNWDEWWGINCNDSDLGCLTNFNFIPQKDDFIDMRSIINDFNMNEDLKELLLDIFPVLKVNQRIVGKDFITLRLDE